MRKYFSFQHYGFIRVYDGTRYLVSFGSEKYDSIYAPIKVDSLLLKKSVTFCSVIIFVKSVWNEDKIITNNIHLITSIITNNF